MMDLTFHPERTDQLDLNLLDRGMPGISPRFGGALAEAAIECFDGQKHLVGVTMFLEGACVHRLRVIWDRAMNEMQRRRTWRDPNPAIEHGAYGIAALIISELTDYTVAARAWKGDGFDFWLGQKDSTSFLFQGLARLEVSGVGHGSRGVLGNRVTQKSKQILRSQYMGLPGVIIVVEFGTPRSSVTCK